MTYVYDEAHCQGDHPELHGFVVPVHLLAGEWPRGADAGAEELSKVELGHCGFTFPLELGLLSINLVFLENCNSFQLMDFYYPPLHEFLFCEVSVIIQFI